MFVLYLLIFFFIIIFNFLFPLIIDKISIQNQIINSKIGKELTKVMCSNNHWFYIEPKITGLELKYFVDENDRMLNCKSDFSSAKKTKICGENGEFNNRYHSCFYLLSELLFYRNIK